MNHSLPTFRTFHDLHVWQVSHELVLRVYRATQAFPKHEVYSLTSQLRRAVLSTAANIVEGSKRRSTPDLCHFLNMAEGSNEEVKYLLLIARDLGYLETAVYSDASSLADRIGAMLYKLTHSLLD